MLVVEQDLLTVVLADLAEVVMLAHLILHLGKVVRPILVVAVEPVV